MAGRRTHVVVGMTAGALTAAYSSQGRTSQLPETVGGLFGGALGGLAPDHLEPAISSWHRSICHSYALAAVGLARLPQQLSAWQEHSRNQADLHDELGMVCTDDASRLWHLLCAFLWRLASGAVLGFAVGYASHLVLDCATPRGLPLVV
jgi:membrane-bound metal-dependent hydrolase YbcI (DUF457 family)